jgi:hypothetical protein
MYLGEGNSMWIARATRKEFIEVIQSGRSPASAEARELDSLDLTRLSSDELQLVWRERPNERASFPALVVVQREHQRDFLAWALTYLASYRPFTSFCRVVDATTASTALGRSGFPTLGRLQDACLGLIFGEVATYLNGMVELRQFTVNACASTFSYVMARAMALKILPAAEYLLTAAWPAVRVATRQPRLTLDTTGILEPWHALVAIAERGGEFGSSGLAPTGLIADACMELYTTGSISGRHWKLFAPELSRLGDAQDEMRGPREERVMAFERAVASLTASHFRENNAGAFLCGYLASQIAPGTLEHAQLLSRHLATFPTALLWYGLCAGLNEKASLESYASGLGRRVLRDLLASDQALDRPRCDIAVSELEILLGNADNLVIDLRQANPGHLVVEVAPCVTTVVRWPSRTEVPANLFPAGPVLEEAKALLAELGQVISRAENIRTRLANVVGLNEGKRERADRKGRRR